MTGAPGVPKIEIRSATSAFRDSVAAQGAGSEKEQEAPPLVLALGVYTCGPQEPGSSGAGRRGRLERERGGDLAERNQWGSRKCVPKIAPQPILERKDSTGGPGSHWAAESGTCSGRGFAGLQRNWPLSSKGRRPEVPAPGGPNMERGSQGHPWPEQDSGPRGQSEEGEDGAPVPG